jgi:uncharacterized protein (DUF111 family)
MLLLVNADDVSGEVVPYVIAGLMERGAKSVHVVPAITKKGRTEYLFLVDTPGAQVETLAGFLATELGVLGVRVFDPQHIRFDYRFCKVHLTTPSGDGTEQTSVGVKQVLDAEGQVIAVKAENDELDNAHACLQGAGATISRAALKRLAELAAQSKTDVSLGPIIAAYEE